MLRYITSLDYFVHESTHTECLLDLRDGRIMWEKGAYAIFF